MKEHDMNIFWKKIVNTINDGLMFIGPEGRIIMVNKAFETLTGYDAAQAAGMSCTMLGCDTCERFMQTSANTIWCKLFEPGQQDMKKCRCLIRRKDGSFLQVLKNASVLRDENQAVMGVVETLTDISELAKLDEKVHLLSRQYDRQDDFYGIVGRSPRMRQVFDMIKKAAESTAPVIILGESGTGKELVANAIHLHGARKNGPFVQLNCAALNEAVLESELFGHAKGAFTGAFTSRIGRFEAANQGDIFLDEIGDIPISLQTKLLRVLESGRFERVGDITPIQTDARIITATNKNLEELIKQEKFRQDLFFRINVIPIHLPPLRQRKQDIPLLITTFLQRLNTKTGKAIKGLDNQTLNLFMDYLWPGNIRELKNALEYAFVVADTTFIGRYHLPRHLTDAPLPDQEPVFPRDTKPFLPDEKAALIQALKKTNGNQTQAARLLSITRVTVWNRMKKHGIDLKRVLSV
ncbi:MAG: sigma 54-interacting transcriptional regulator [Desulfotignum sp.]|nr:sigma 54-interacting transcriptional regulator [Desulfotignum sp.]MCF8114546.1 sigma 54-interacting transcriptional regulator [Desulfotignum sp.]MCF8125059.1 sigma 54-interacting transcriptional regulator [Desulfotignum sp.]